MSSDGALEHLQRVHGPALLAYLVRLTRGDVHRAEDILQETLLRAWRNPAERDEQGHWSRPWLFTVARRVFIDSVRRGEARPAELPGEFLDVAPGPDDHIERLLDARAVRDALDSLPERMRLTLIEIFFRERSLSEAADALDIPLGTIKSRSHYGLRALREALLRRGFDFR